MSIMTNIKYILPYLVPSMEGLERQYPNVINAFWCFVTDVSFHSSIAGAQFGCWNYTKVDERDQVAYRRVMIREE